MKKRLYIKNIRFLRNFGILLTVLLIVVFIFAGSIYSTSLRTVQQEIKGINENTTYELMNRVEDVLMGCSEIAGNLALDEKIQLYFTYSNPENLVGNYYTDVARQLNVYAMPYIDSILLYAPKYERIFDSSDGWNVKLDEMWKTNQNYDISWIDDLEENDRTTSVFYTRAKADKWPYYITLLMHWRQGEAEGVILVNVNLEKLHDYLIAERNESMQLFLVDEEQRVILQRDKQELYTTLEEVDNLAEFRLGESFSSINVEGKSAHTYVQAYSEKYNITCVTVTAINDYFLQITEVQKRFIGMICIMTVAAMVLAFVYSVKLVKPLQDIQYLLNSPNEWQADDKRYSEEVREIADQIVTHLQTNSLLREELDERLDLLKDAQMLALQAQINPHFVFNTLNIACLMIETDSGEGHPAVKILGGLSDILRYSLSKNENVCVREEIKCVEKYLSIMQYRYGEFETIIDVDENVLYYAIPKLVLQPLVENALRHGISLSMGSRPGMIKVQAKEMSYTYENGETISSICIDVIDNGVGIDTERLETLRDSITQHNNITREHIGFSNVAHRLYLIFHNTQKVTIESVFGKGTQVRLIFPALTIRSGKTDSTEV